MRKDTKSLKNQKYWTGMFVFIVMVIGCATDKRPEQPRAIYEDSETKVSRWQLETDSLGQVPAGWGIRQTNPTKSLATWKVIKDKTTPAGQNVMALTKSDNYNQTYNLAIAEKSRFKDLDLTVLVKAVQGKEDQGGGPIWRCLDENNYYICRINPLESNYRIYKVVNGKRKQLDSAKVELETGRWYTLRVTMIGNHIACYLDGKKMLEVNDETLAGPGMVGLWTKADAVTSFDDLIVKALDR